MGGVHEERRAAADVVQEVGAEADAGGGGVRGVSGGAACRGGGGAPPLHAPLPLGLRRAMGPDRLPLPRLSRRRLPHLTGAGGQQQLQLARRKRILQRKLSPDTVTDMWTRERWDLYVSHICSFDFLIPTRQLIKRIASSPLLTVTGHYYPHPLILIDSINLIIYRRFLSHLLVSLYHAHVACLCYSIMSRSNSL